MSRESRAGAIQDALFIEAIALIEQAGPLEDAQAMRTAAAAAADSGSRIAARARELGQRVGLQHTLQRARGVAPWVALGLVALVVTAGLSLAGTVVGDRRINVMVALVSLLGAHGVTLALWVVGLALPAGAFRFSFGGLWLALTARVAGGHTGQAPVLARAATRLLARARLLPWALGFVSHAIWTFSFAVVLASLLFALAFRNYTLSWESTILEPAFFVRAVQALGALPALFGFPVPDANAVLAATPAGSTMPGAGQRAWALWLTGCIVCYGLLPRALLALLCAGVWRLRRARMTPDTTEPAYRKLVTRFDAMAPARVTDADPGAPPAQAPRGLQRNEVTDARLAIAFELPGDWAWPPIQWEAMGFVTSRVDGSAAQRRAVLDQLAHARPHCVLVACAASASPDRGTARFLRDVAALSGECRVWLVAAGDGVADATGVLRWRTWLADTGLGGLQASERLADVIPEKPMGPTGPTPHANERPYGRGPAA
ncbi:DUF2868 domain-containing protein [Variovorax ginsengisoli]|uniref:DUF2868 domain-containing protein n=1 Tax=Variovorax ginsengisoli TaxID=363844 RepID=A0ABT9S6G8_9BURK|nr:DUF2868 domain-containing protein [Variovorax ginsengisoli]MDP9898907.1 hypothetical protein [Variovorax ginsengisoli]